MHVSSNKKTAFYIMKKIFASFGWILLLLPLISVAGARTALMFNKALVSEESRDVSGFTGISSGGSFKVYVVFGQKESLRLEGNEDILKEIETRVENGTLRIGFKKTVNCSFWRSGINIGRINVYVTAVKLNSLTCSGSGDIEVKGAVKSASIQTTVSGSGSISLQVSSDSYVASISGSGHITATGTTKAANIQVSGSGNFRGRDLRTESSNVRVSGSGNIDIMADNAITATVSGSGNIRYGGNATMITTTKSGSGRVSRM
jgi:hypothetical protein